ncbi:MAG: hypothetical protein Q9200_005485 [Gallowayella weberi]
MPKKRNQSYISKPPTSVHPSITNRHHDVPRDEQSDKSVNLLLQQLRISQAASMASSEPRSDLNPKTVHPSLKHILQIPETPPLRPRPGMRPATIQGRRRPPGPAPPRSWSQSSHPANVHSQRASLLHQSHHALQRPNLEMLSRFPNFHLPHRHSLQHLALVQLAKHWDFHINYDQYHLPLLPIRYKQLLLTYVAAYSSTGINLHGLSTLFANDSIIEDATGTEDLTHLDLSISIGRSLSLKDLKQFITAILAASTSIDASTPDSWDIPASLSPIPTCTLTHLSLSHPPPSISWRQLLQLSPQLNTLTHLSLSHWPPPTLTPNSTTAYRSTPTGDISYGDHDLYSASLDNEFSGAAHVLRQLSRDTYCLQWLDVSGCSSWLPALAWRRGGIDWDGAWSSIDTVVVAQGWMPEPLKEEGRGWKDILHGVHGSESSPPSPELKRLNRELKQWLSAEVESRAILQRIRGKKVEEGDGWQRLDDGAFDQLGRGHGSRRDADYNNHRSDDESRTPKPKRIRTVEFDYGWAGWWIEECLSEYGRL